MQGERNGACASEINIHVTLFVLLFVLICSLAFGFNEENNELAAKKRTLDPDSSTDPPIVVYSSSSSSSSPSGSLLSTTSFTSTSLQALSAIAFDHERLRTSEILRELLKVDALHLVQEVLVGLEGQVTEARNQSHKTLASIGASDLNRDNAISLRLDNTEVAYPVQGDYLMQSWKRPDILVEALKEVPVLLFMVEREVEGATLRMNHTKTITDPSQQHIFPDADLEISRSYGRCASVGRSR